MTASRPVDDPIDAWVLQTSHRALGYAATLTRNQEDAEDIVHDCYVRLLAKKELYDLPNDGMKLLFRSITHAAINLAQRRPPETSLNQWEQITDKHGQAMADRYAAQPVEGAMQLELATAVAKAMNELPVTQRAAVELRSLGHTLIEVADMLEISHANARVMLHRARTTLAAKLQPYLEDQSL